MALSLQNEQKEHLNYIANQSTTVLSKILSNISSGSLSDKEVNSLNNEEHATRALLKLLIDAKHLRLGEKDFSSQTKLLMGINDEFVELMWNFLINEPVIDELISSDEYKFRDLEWRLEVKVASRFLHFHSSPDPKIVMKFHLDREMSLKHRQILSDDSQETTRKELLVQTNINNLLHIIEQLESAKTAVSLKKGV